MTQELGLLELVLGASLLVQIVMLILVLASITSWFLIIQRTMLMRRTDDELLSFEERFWSGIDLAQLYREGNQAVADGQLPTGVESLFRAGFKEFSRLSQQSDIDADGMLEGSRRAMKVALMRETDRIEQHLPFLASVGSTSPYIGLFGTVWGIMHSLLPRVSRRRSSPRRWACSPRSLRFWLITNWLPVAMCYSIVMRPLLTNFRAFFSVRPTH